MTRAVSQVCRFRLTAQPGPIILEVLWSQADLGAALLAETHFMLKIRRIDWGDLDARIHLDTLRNSLSVEDGQVTEASQQRTIEVFGEPLSPLSVVRRIIDEVRLRGDEAVAKYCEKLDGAKIEPGHFRLDPSRFKASWEGVDEDFRNALRLAASNIEKFQRMLVKDGSTVLERDGVRLESVVRPLRRVGVYIPGGAAAYPSAVLMDVIPAQVAGCREIAVATPAGKLNDHVMAAFHLLGLDEVYSVGGATAVAMLAYGTESVPAVDMIVGAGNTFVNLAKREVCGAVKIDMFAGPSEILVIADDTADCDLAAADLLSQAEHYPGSAILVTTSQALAEEIVECIERQLVELPRRDMCRESLERYGAIVKVSDIHEAVEVANLVAPEHLEIMTRAPREIAARIENAGTVFVGSDTPEAAGDYVAGSSHTLPTGGTARFAEGLSALDFQKRMSIIEYSRQALQRELPAILSLAGHEGLDAHARAAARRFEKD